MTLLTSLFLESIPIIDLFVCLATFAILSFGHTIHINCSIDLSNQVYMSQPLASQTATFPIEYANGFLLNPSSNLTIEGFTDADWGTQLDDRHSSSGYLVYLGSNLVSWSTTKQRIVSRSSVESEYRGLVMATAEIIWMQALLQE
ncbi:hypothetical protein UlMin_016046 [Ulmus minor]